tara:strand:+ start:370 stop:1182 length:813 start_codon:yes stop_codon:yes gene_type:complete
MVVIATGPALAQSGTTVPLGSYLQNLPTVEATVAGETGTFLLDTGGGISVLSEQFAERIGCRPWGRLTGFRLSGERLDGARCDNVVVELGGTSLAVPAAGVIDLAVMLPPQPPIAGIISLDAFVDQPFTLDLARRRIILESRESLRVRTADAVEVPVQFVRQAGGYSLTVMAQVETPSGDLWFQLDSGGVPPLLIAPHAAVAMGLAADAPPDQPILLDLGTADRSAAAVATTVEVRPGMIIDGNIGEPTMARTVLTFDLANQKLWVRTNP